MISYEAIITECFAFRDEKKIQTGNYSYDEKNNYIGFVIVRIDSNGDELLNIKSESTYDEKGYIACKENIKERDHAIRKIHFIIKSKVMIFMIVKVVELKKLEFTIQIVTDINYLLLKQLPKQNWLQ